MTVYAICILWLNPHYTLISSCITYPIKLTTARLSFLQYFPIKIPSIAAMLFLADYYRRHTPLTKMLANESR